MEGIEYRTHIPSKHTAIPQELSTLIEDLRHLQVRLLCESLHLHEVLVFRISELNVPIACLRTRGTYAKRNQLGVVMHIIQRAAYRFIKDILLEDQVISRSNDNISIGILCLDMVGCPADTGCCITAHRL